MKLLKKLKDANLKKRADNKKIVIKELDEAAIKRRDCTSYNFNYFADYDLEKYYWSDLAILPKLSWALLQEVKALKKRVEELEADK